MASESKKDDTAHNKKRMLEAQLDVNKEKKETSSPIELATETCITYSVDQVELTQKIKNAGAVKGSSQDPKEQKGDELKDDDSKEPTNSMRRTPHGEVDKKHNAILAEFEKFKLNSIKPEPGDVSRLMAFTGYYQTSQSERSFLTVDTNICVSDNKPYNFVEILVFDGQTSSAYQFYSPFAGCLGTFANGKLVLNDGSGHLDLQFTPQNNNGIVASFTGTINGTIVKGATQNNPIPYSMYIGQYYDVATKSVAMAIKDNYQLEFDYGRDQLAPVSKYVYNVNMYYFSFGKIMYMIRDVLHGISVSLIMGTSAAGGFECFNIIQDSVRMLQTILSPVNVAPVGGPNKDSFLLAPCCGYYSINNKKSSLNGAFVSMLAKRTSPTDDWKVSIGVSMDGTSSKGYTFDSTMSYKIDVDTNVLDIPNVLRVYLTRGNPGSGQLVQLSGTVMGQLVTGFTRLNPIGLFSGFGGEYRETADGPVILNIKSDTEVVYNGATFDSFVYIPMMYILYIPSLIQMFSLGTDGAKGKACIVLDVTSSPMSEKNLYAIP